MDQLLDRAYRAYSRRGERLGGIVDTPSQYCSGIEEYKDRSYIVLRNGCRVLAVFRILNDGTLRRIKGTAMHWEDC